VVVEEEKAAAAVEEQPLRARVFAEWCHTSGDSAGRETQARPTRAESIATRPQHDRNTTATPACPGSDPHP